MASTGGHRREGRAARPVARLLLHALVAMTAAFCWWLLVDAAVHFGHRATDGRDLDWVWLILCSVAAVGCLLVALWFAWRMLVLVGLLREYEPRRARR